MAETGEILLYQNSEGNISIDVRLNDETVWLTQEQMARLFGKGRSTITEHIANVYKEGELEQNRTSRKFRQVRQEGNRAIEREIEQYNLDVIISVGYRVKSHQGTQFRIWATQRLKEYIIKGFALNDERFESGSLMNYFNVLQERIRKIRLSENSFIKKLKTYTKPVSTTTQRTKKQLNFLKLFKTNYSGLLVSKQRTNWSIVV